MKIAPASVTDYAQIADLWERSVLATHHFLADDFTTKIKPQLITDYLPQVSLFKLTNEDDTITGFLGVADHKIEMLFIEPKWFGKGLGKLLVQFAIEELDAKEVDVNEQNEQAVGFYLKMGFQIFDRTEKDAQGMDYPILKMRRGKSER